MKYKGNNTFLKELVEESLLVLILVIVLVAILTHLYVEYMFLMMSFIYPFMNLFYFLLLLFCLLNNFLLLCLHIFNYLII